MRIRREHALKFGAAFRGNDLQGHERRMSPGPGHGGGLGLEKAIDHDGSPLQFVSSALACRFAIDHVRSGIDGDASYVRKNYFAAEWNPFGIDRAMAVTQACAVVEGAQAAAFSLPVNSYARE